LGRFKKTRLTAEERAAIKLKRHLHLRQIKQSYVHKEAIHGPFFHAGDQTLATFLSMLNGKGPILVASNDRHARRLATAGYKFVWQVDQPVSQDDVLLGKVLRKPEAQGSLARLKFSQPMTGAFVCERLQKQGNLHDYLVALRKSVEIDAPVALVVPNVHHELIDDHVNLFTAGTLIYAMIRAGWNCRDATVFYDKRYINVLLRRLDVPEPWPTKVDDLQPYAPFKNVFNYCSSEFTEVYRT
jgi:hypothetical protein